jgi:FkbM family methyltransferase
MKQQLINLAKSALSSYGFFVARHHPEDIRGHELTHDLTKVVRGERPLCFDVGGNKGQTIELLQSCYSRPAIHSFEPASATYAALATRNFGPLVHCHPYAFGAHEGVAEFRNYKHSELSSFLPMHTDTAENIFAREEMVSTESVQVTTLDRFCATQGITRIDLLKIDAQGYELPVLQGGSDLLEQQRVGAVLLELNFSTLYEGQSDPLDVIRLLRSYNMRLVDFYEKERVTGKELSWTTALFVHHP